MATDTVIFNNEERIILNSMACGDNPIPLEELTRAWVISCVQSSINIVGDELLVAQLVSLKDTLESLTDEEWDLLKLLLPFPVPYGIDDFVD